MITPMVARLVSDLFDREGWLFELKWDGFRAIAEMDGQGAVKLYSRNHNDSKKSDSCRLLNPRWRDRGAR